MPGHNHLKYLFDIVEAGKRIQSFTSGRSYEDYLGDPLLQSAVERQFEIIGEALNQAIRIDPSLSSRIEESSKIIAFRNYLIHRYASVTHEVVWGVIESYLPDLLRKAEEILNADSF